MVVRRWLEAAEANEEDGEDDDDRADGRASVVPPMERGGVSGCSFA